MRKHSLGAVKDGKDRGCFFHFGSGGAGGVKQMLTVGWDSLNRPKIRILKIL